MIVMLSLSFCYQAMPKFLRVVEWSNLDQVTEVHRLLKVWAPVTMEVC